MWPCFEKRIDGARPRKRDDRKYDCRKQMLAARMQQRKLCSTCPNGSDCHQRGIDESQPAKLTHVGPND
jgi:hypothetical protein